MGDDVVCGRPERPALPATIRLKGRRNVFVTVPFTNERHVSNFLYFEPSAVLVINVPSPRRFQQSRRTEQPRGGEYEQYRDNSSTN